MSRPWVGHGQRVGSPCLQTALLVLRDGGYSRFHHRVYTARASGRTPKLKIVPKIRFVGGN